MAIARLSSRPCLDPLDPRETLSIGSRAVRSGLARCDVVEKAKTADLLVVSEVAPFPLTLLGYAAAASAGVSWVVFSYSIGLW